MQHWWKNWQRKPMHSPVLTHKPAKLPRTVSMGTECFRPVSVKNDDFCSVFMWWGEQSWRAHLGKCTPEIEYIYESEKQASSYTHYFGLLVFQTLQIIKKDNIFFLFFFFFYTNVKCSLQRLPIHILLPYHLDNVCCNFFLFLFFYQCYLLCEHHWGTDL